VIHTACVHDLPRLRALFVRANDAPYDLAAVAEEKCFGPGVSGEPVVRVYGDYEGVAVTCGRYLRVMVVDRSARRRGVGSALLADAEAHGADVIAAEPGNYLTPGIVDTDQASLAFFQKHGYIETRWTWNLDVETRAVPAAENSAAGTRRPPHSEAERVLTFIEREFGRIWRFEASKSFEDEIPRMFISEEGGEVNGFAVHDVNNRGLGFFGPTGVVKSMRGRGLGCALLRASLGDLRRLGYERAVIPWTEAVGFYRKCSGAEAAHRFIAYAKPK
jgi:GNAT superfamily N-acetyltransferase